MMPFLLARPVLSNSPSYLLTDMIVGFVWINTVTSQHVSAMFILRLTEHKVYELPLTDGDKGMPTDA